MDLRVTTCGTILIWYDVLTGMEEDSAVIVYPRQKKPRGTKRFVIFFVSDPSRQNKRRGGGAAGGPGGGHRSFYFVPSDPAPAKSFSKFIFSTDVPP